MKSKLIIKLTPEQSAQVNAFYARHCDHEGMVMLAQSFGQEMHVALFSRDETRQVAELLESFFKETVS